MKQTLPTIEASAGDTTRLRAVAALITALAAPAMSACASASDAAGSSPQAPDPQTSDSPISNPQSSALPFARDSYTSLQITIDGQPMTVRWYKEVCYVARPILMASTQPSTMGGGSSTITIENPQCGYQSMNIYVPEATAADQQTAIYFAVNNGGWFASYVKASVSDGASFDSSTSNIGAALKAGYVYIDVGTRGRGVVAADGSYPGKAPAAIVDAKAAVRYLRLNDAAMPGSAERIVVNGTSGGGGLSAILGASGNSPDYLPYLAAVGAAGVDDRGRNTLRDDVFAINAYCPITDLGNADLAYEWLYTALNTRAAVGTDPSASGSAEIAARFPAYERGLHLVSATGQPLTTDTLLAAIQSEVKRSAETYLGASSDHIIPDLGQTMTVTGMGGTRSYVNDWIDVDSTARKVVAIDMTKYLKFVATQATLKLVPAFDNSGLASVTTSGESNLFGPATQVYSNFTEYSWNHNDVPSDGSGADDTGLTWSSFLSSSGRSLRDEIDLINPMRYIATGATTAPHWYVRHGTRDRDTAFTVSLNLSRALVKDPRVDDVNYRLAWDQPHAGNYDVPEAMAWIAASVGKATR